MYIYMYDAIAHSRYTVCTHTCTSQVANFKIRQYVLRADSANVFHYTVYATSIIIWTPMETYMYMYMYMKMFFLSLETVF